MEWNNKVAAMHGLEMAFPFLDRDLISFLMAIPGEVSTHQGVPKALLREGMRGVVPKTILKRRWKADFTSLVNEGLDKAYPRLIQNLDRGRSVELGYLKGEVLKAKLVSFRGQLKGPSSETAWALSDLLGLEIWLQTFFSQEGSLYPSHHRGEEFVKLHEGPLA
jgi:asparagine synthase (glutamine-hydrolysing)